MLFTSRMPAPLLPIQWKGEKLIKHASGVAHLVRYELPHVTLGDQHWDSLPGFVLDTQTAAYPSRIAGVRASGVVAWAPRRRAARDGDAVTLRANATSLTCWCRASGPGHGSW